MPGECCFMINNSSHTSFFFVERAKPKSNVDAKEDWSSVFGFGVMSKDKQILDEVKPDEVTIMTRSRGRGGGR